VARRFTTTGVSRRALESYDAALRRRPDFVHALNNRGISLHALKRFEEALASYQSALAAHSDFPEALARRGAVLHELGRFEEALAGYDRALARRPSIPRHFPIGAPHSASSIAWSRRWRASIAPSRYLLTTPRRSPTAALRFSSGVALQELKRHTEALDRFDRALAIRPDHVDALYNRGSTLISLKRFARALTDFDQTLAISPDPPHTFGAAANCAIQLCDWERRAGFAAQMAARVAEDKSIIPPFTLLGYSGDPALQLRCARNYINRMIPPAPQPARTDFARRGGKLRVAYLSADFRKHATAYRIAELIELHDRSRFEIVGISFGPDDKSGIRGRLVAGSDRFHDVRGLSDSEVATFVRRLEVDIAVDLMGFTQDSRLGVFACRPAPIQVNYLAYPGTTGAHFIDLNISPSSLRRSFACPTTTKLTTASEGLRRTRRLAWRPGCLSTVLFSAVSTMSRR
jgi:tetratricopeptide (TPR) repeat protein